MRSRRQAEGLVRLLESGWALTSRQRSETRLNLGFKGKDRYLRDCWGILNKGHLGLNLEQDKEEKNKMDQETAPGIMESI